MWASTCFSVTLSLCPDVQNLVALLFALLCHRQGLHTDPYIIAWYATPKKWNHTSQWCRSWLWVVRLFSMHFQSISWFLKKKEKKKETWTNSSSYWPKRAANVSIFMTPCQSLTKTSRWHKFPHVSIWTSASAQHNCRHGSMEPTHNHKSTFSFSYNSQPVEGSHSVVIVVEQ